MQLLPDKYVPVEETVIGLGAIALSELDTPVSVSTLWRKMMKHPEVATYERFILALDFLFAVNAIVLSGKLLARRKP